MDNSDGKNLDLTACRTYGVFLIPTLWQAIQFAYRFWEKITNNLDYSDITDSGNLTDLMGFITYLLWSGFCIYLLFFGKAAASVLQYLMAKWSQEKRTNALAFAIRIIGLNLLISIIIEILQSIAAIVCIDNLDPKINAYAIVFFILRIAAIYYLLFRGNILLGIIEQTIDDKKDFCLIAIRIIGLSYLPFALMQIVNLVSSTIYFGNQYIDLLKNDAFSVLFKPIFHLGLTAYFLFAGKTAAKFIQHFMNKWHEPARELPAAYFIRAFGLYIIIGQIKAFILILDKMYGQGRLEEFTTIYNLPNLLNLSCLDSLIMIIACLAIAWYLLNHGKLLLGFINRNK